MWKEIIFAFVMIIYLIQLNGLNRELNFYEFDNSFALLQYKDFIPIKFFLVAVVLFSVGCILVYHDFRYWRKSCDSFEEMITIFLTIVIIIILLILLIIFIDNPILKAILSVVLTICGLAGIKG